MDLKNRGNRESRANKGFYGTRRLKALGTRGKKAQASQTFNYIMIMLVVGLILIIGVYWIGKIPNQACKARYESFTNDLINEVNSIASQNARKDMSELFKICNDHKAVCFRNRDGTVRDGVDTDLLMFYDTNPNAKIFLIDNKGGVESYQIDNNRQITVTGVNPDTNEKRDHVVECFEFKNGIPFMVFIGHSRYLEVTDVGVQGGSASLDAYPCFCPIVTTQQGIDVIQSSNKIQTLFTALDYDAEAILNWVSSCVGSFQQACSVNCIKCPDVVGNDGIVDADDFESVFLDIGQSAFSPKNNLNDDNVVNWKDLTCVSNYYPSLASDICDANGRLITGTGGTGGSGGLQLIECLDPDSGDLTRKTTVQITQGNTQIASDTDYCSTNGLESGKTNSCSGSNCKIVEMGCSSSSSQQVKQTVNECYSCSNGACTQQSAPVVSGDVDLDGDVDIRDTFLTELQQSGYVSSLPYTGFFTAQMCGQIADIINNDDVVNTQDVQAFSTNAPFGTCASTDACSKYDVDRSGIIDDGDRDIVSKCANGIY